MDKQSLYIVLGNWLNEEGNCVYVHLVDKTDLLIFEKPNFNSLTFSVNMKHSFGDESISETHIIPYSAVVYVTQTNLENVKIVNDYYNRIVSKKDMSVGGL